MGRVRKSWVKDSDVTRTFTVTDALLTVLVDKDAYIQSLLADQLAALPADATEDQRNAVEKQVNAMAPLLPAMMPMEKTVRFPAQYTEDELEKALPELGYKGTTIQAISYKDVLVVMRASDFWYQGDIVKVSDHEEDGK